MVDEDAKDIIAYANRLAMMIAKHDPCENCSHGRMLHKRQTFRDLKIRERDSVMTEKQCRHGIEKTDGCTCPEWVGTETPFPEWV